MFGYGVHIRFWLNQYMMYFSAASTRKLTKALVRLALMSRGDQHIRGVVCWRQAVLDSCKISAGHFDGVQQFTSRVGRWPCGRLREASRVVRTSFDFE